MGVKQADFIGQQIEVKNTGLRLRFITAAKDVFFRS